MGKCFFGVMTLMTFFIQGFCNDQCCSTNFENLCCSSPAIEQPSIEFKAGYFCFTNDRMRNIYNDGGYEIQLSGSYPINSPGWSWLQMYGSIGYQESRGRSLGGHQSTKLSKVFLNTGLKSIFTVFEGFQYYLAIGPRFFFLHQHNNSSFVNRRIDYNNIGAFVNTGFNYFISCNWFVDVFAEYSYEKVHFHTHRHNVYDRSIQVGGFTFGAGIGHTF